MVTNQSGLENLVVNDPNVRNSLQNYAMANGLVNGANDAQKRYDFQMKMQDPAELSGLVAAYLPDYNAAQAAAPAATPTTPAHSSSRGRVKSLVSKIMSNTSTSTKAGIATGIATTLAGAALYFANLNNPSVARVIGETAAYMGPVAGVTAKSAMDVKKEKQWDVIWPSIGATIGGLALTFSSEVAKETGDVLKIAGGAIEAIGAGRVLYLRNKYKA